MQSFDQIMQEQKTKYALKELEKHGEYKEEDIIQRKPKAKADGGIGSHILNYFKFSDRFYLDRINSGMAFGFSGNPITLAKPGTPDIYGFDLVEGNIIFIETKSQTGELRPNQEEFRDKVQKTKRGIYILARSLDDVLAVLEPRDPLPF